MKTTEFLNEFVNPTSHKVRHDLEEYNKIKLSGAVAVKATTFYQIYKHNVYPTNDNRFSMQEFYRVCGQYFYYDKYVCEHGTEFYYYVTFNKDNPMFKATEAIVAKRIYANRPEKLKDLLYKVEAVTKQ